MTYLWKWAALIVFAPSLVLAQPGSSTPTQPNESPANPPGATSTSSTAATSQPFIADSKTLEIIHAQKADYPIEAERKEIQGEVIVKVQVSETGDVEKTEVLSGEPILADSAVRAARKFKFKPFIRNGKPIKVSTSLPFDFYFSDRVIATSIPKDMNREDASANSAPEGNTDPDLPKRVRVSAGVTTGLLIRKIAPVYPREAKQNHIQGSVVLRAVIGKDGHIKNLTPISGPKELIQASIGAVQQWQYRPYLLMGQPVEVDTQITVNFALSPF